jgi:class 3 adenylate cyclase/PAS domain-containing protein
MAGDGSTEKTTFPSDLLSQLLVELSQAKNIQAQGQRFLSLLHSYLSEGIWDLNMTVSGDNYSFCVPSPQLLSDQQPTWEWSDEFRYGRVTLNWYSSRQRRINELEDQFLHLSILLLIRHIELTEPSREQRWVDMELSRLTLFSDTITELSRQINTRVNFLDDLDQILFSSATFLNASKGFVYVDFNQQSHLEVFGLDDEELQSLKQLINGNFDIDQEELRATLEDVLDLILHPLRIEGEQVGWICFINKEQRQGVERFEELDQRMVSTIVNSLEIALTKLSYIISQQELIDLNKTILNSVSSGIVATDAQLRILLINEKAHQLLNMNGDEVIGTPLLDCFSVNSPVRTFIQEAVEVHQKAAVSDIPLSAMNPTKVNAHYAPMQQSDINHKNGKGHVFTFDDVTEFSKLKDSFSTYVSREVLEIVQEQSHRLRLGGERKHCAVLFCDIRGFTALSESKDPERVVETLNQYYNLMIEAVNSFQGSVDKIVGDEIMAVYYQNEDHQHAGYRAAQTALEMRQNLELLNELRESQGDQPVAFGIGIAFGEVICGNIGSFDRMDYTVIGDTVNLASRLCSAARPNEILMSDAVHQSVLDLNSVPLDPINVKGKQKPVDIYSLEPHENP